MVIKRNQFNAPQTKNQRYGALYGEIMSLDSFVKSADAIDKIRHSCQLVAKTLTMIEPYVVPGVTTDELNNRCHDYIVNDLGARPSSLGYSGFPKSVCISVNHVVCHGIPSEKKLKDGDILNIDILIEKNGYHGDSSRMYFVGKPSVKAKRVCEVTQACLYGAIEMVKPGACLRDIGRYIDDYARKHRMSVVKDYCGHGIGSEIHEAGFQVLHFDAPELADKILLPGLTFTIEPMINFGKEAVKTLSDGWTVVTKDRSLSAQWEHTLLVTETGVEVLTLREEEKGVLVC